MSAKDESQCQEYSYKRYVRKKLAEVETVANEAQRGLLKTNSGKR